MLCLSYKPPSSLDGYFSSLVASLKKITPTYTVLLTGDFKYFQLTCLPPFLYPLTDAVASCYCDISKDCLLIQLVKDPIRGMDLYSVMILMWHPLYSIVIIYLALMQSFLIFLFYLQGKGMFTPNFVQNTDSDTFHTIFSTLPWNLAVSDDINLGGSIEKINFCCCLI